MITNEFETTEQLEMVYLYHLGIPHEIDRTNPHRIKMIFKCDLDFVTAKLEDFWNGNTRVDARKIMNDWQNVKRLLWVGQAYDKNFYNKNKNDQDNTSPVRNSAEKNQG